MSHSGHVPPTKAPATATVTTTRTVTLDHTTPAKTQTAPSDPRLAQSAHVRSLAPGEHQEFPLPKASTREGQPPVEPQPIVYATPQERAIAAGRDPQPNKHDATGGCPGGSPSREPDPLPKDAKAGNEGAYNVSAVDKPVPNQQPPRWG